MPRRLTNLTLSLLLSALAMPAVSRADVSISIRVGPPALPVYTQPPCPQDGYLWVPGYWAYSPDGYYWVPGTWVQPPRPNYLWTPGYWGVNSGVYGWHPGYWGPHVGFYGGVNYGFGYSGVGFGGGAWRGNAFHYNTAVTNVNTTVVHNTYVDRTVVHNTVINNTRVNNVTVNRASFNGPGGVTAQPSAQELMAQREQHVQPTQQQAAHQQMASHDRGNLYGQNHGRPAQAAMARPHEPGGPGNREYGGAPGAAPRVADQHAGNGRVEQPHPSQAHAQEHAAPPVTEHRGGGGEHGAGGNRGPEHGNAHGEHGSGEHSHEK